MSYKLPLNFYQNLDPTYLKRIQKLNEDFKAANFCEYRRQKLLFEFAGKYMMPKELWNIYFRYRPVDNHEPFKNLINLTHYHFYYNSDKTDYAAHKHRIYSRLLYRKIMDISEPANFGDYRPEDICYPHFDLNKRRNAYEEKISSLIPLKIIRRHEAMKKLYQKIKAVEKDEEKWIETMFESGDIEFVEHNIEYRIGKDLTNKKLWKLYIQFLKKYDKKTLMQTYSKYIRFFLDDLDMKMEYQKAVEAQKCQLAVLWKNSYSMEKSVEVIKNPKQRLIAARKRKKSNWHKKLKFNYKNVKSQKFPFRPDLIDYVLDGANANILRNLFKTCKWFYIRNPATICYKFVFSKFNYSPRRNDDEIAFDNRAVFLKDIYITTFLTIYDIDQIYISRFVKRLYRCDARHIDICHQSLTTAELKCFIGNGNVAKLELKNVIVTDNPNIVLEDIIKLTPKIEYLSIYPSNHLQIPLKYLLI